MVTEIRELCKKNGTSIKALEKKLGFGNGTISRWEKNVPAIEKVKAVANFFNVPLSYLTGEEQKEKPPAHGREPMYPEWYGKLTSEEIEQVRKYAEFLIAERRKDQS